MYLLYSKLNIAPILELIYWIKLVTQAIMFIWLAFTQMHIYRPGPVTRSDARPPGIPSVQQNIIS